MKLNSWRGAGLFILALTSAARGWQYTFNVPHTLPTGINDLSLDGRWIVLLGVLWFVTAALGAWSAFRVRDLPGVFALAAMHALWAAALAYGAWTTGGDWLPTVTTAGFFGLIVCWSRMVNPPHSEQSIEDLLSRTGR